MGNEPFKFLLNKEQLNKLKKFGFEYSTHRDPYFPEDEGVTNLKEFEDYDDINLTYSVVCNQDDVIYFLLSNKIPFVSLCHYEEELVTWDGVSDYFIEMENPVNKFSKCIGDVKEDGSKYTLDDFAQSKKIKQIKIKDFLEREDSFKVNSKV